MKALEFIWTQPLHKTLRQMRFVTIGVLVASIDILYRLVGVLQAGDLSTEKAVAVTGLAATVFGGIWKAVDSVKDVYKDDD